MDTIGMAGRAPRAQAQGPARLMTAGLVLALAVIALIAWMRLEGAGFGCANWPGCYRSALHSGLPLVEAAQPVAAAIAFALLARLWARTRAWPRPVDAEPLAALLWPARIAIIVIVAEIALGGWLVANRAALACTDFPTCQGQWWPAANFAAGFAPGGARGAASSLQALTAIHLAHRLGALLALLVAGWVGWRALRSHGASRLGAALLAALAVQVALGAASVLSGLALAVALAHHAAAAVLLGVAVVLHLRAYRAQFWV